MRFIFIFNYFSIFLQKKIEYEKNSIVNSFRIWLFDGLAQLDTTIYRHGNKITIQENEDGFNIFVDKEGVESSEDSTALEEIGLIL